MKHKTPNLRELKKLFNQILKDNGLKDWKVLSIMSGGGLCLLKNKEIWLDYRNYNLPFFLHEMTHALGYIGHDGVWADKYTALCVKYLDK